MEDIRDSNKCCCSQASNTAKRRFPCAIQCAHSQHVSLGSKKARSVASSDCYSCWRSFLWIYFAWTAFASNLSTNVPAPALFSSFRVSQFSLSGYTMTKYVTTTSDSSKVPHAVRPWLDTVVFSVLGEQLCTRCSAREYRPCFLSLQLKIHYFTRF